MSGHPTRRAVLGLAVAAAGAPLAGCTGGDDGPAPSPTPTPTPTATPAATTAAPATTSGPSAQVRADVDVAAEDLSRASDVFLEETDRLAETFEFVDVRAEVMVDDVDLGMETLAGVERATDDPPPVVAVLRTVGEWLALLADALGAYAAGLDALETAAVYVRNDRYADAVEELEPSEASFRAVGTHVEAADARYPEIDVGPLAGLDDRGPGAVRDQLEDVRGSAADLGAYAATMAHYVAGLVDHTNGRERYDAGDAAAEAERYDDAAGAFEDAVGHFEAAREDAVAGEEAAPTPLLEEVVRLTCSAAHYRAAAEHYRTAVNEADRGDTADAEAAYDEALAAEDEAAAC